MSNHGPMMGCFDPGCPQCSMTASVERQYRASTHVNCLCNAELPCRRSCPECRAVPRGLSCPCQHKPEQSSYARYREIGNRPEKPKSFIAWDLAGDNFTQVIMDEMTKAFALTPAELGVVEKSNYSKETNDMSPFTFSIDLGNISSQSSSPTPEQRLLSVVSDLAKDNPDLARKFKNAADCAEREHKEGIEKALKGVNYLAMKEGHSGRDFCVSFWRGGEAHSLDGTDYAYGQRISEDDVEDESRVFVSGSIFPASGAYYTMDNLKKRLEGNGILYVIEYYPDQD